MRRSTLLALSAALVPATMLLAACAGSGGLELTPVASFGAANAFSKSGFSETQVSDTEYKVTATGTEATPKSRLEKIARARAAQIGVEKNLKYYKVANVQYGKNCSKPHNFHKGGSTAAESRQTVEIAVVYAKEPSDPAFLSSEDSFSTLNGELATEIISSEEKATAAAEARAGCGLPV